MALDVAFERAPVRTIAGAIGYGTEDGDDYWLVKNSWGSGWGGSGYIKLVAGKDLCGLADAASYPTL